MPTDVGPQVAALEHMTVAELRARYAEVFGETTQAGHKTWLAKRIAWRLQALAEGDLSERARRRAAELASDADLRLAPPKGNPATPDPGFRVRGQQVPLPVRRGQGRHRLPLQRLPLLPSARQGEQP